MRTEVKAFAQAMEKRMKEFDAAKGEDGYKELAFGAMPLITRLRSKLDSLARADAEYFAAFNARKVPRTDLEPLRQKVLQIAADVGNYAMLIAAVDEALPEVE